MRLIILIPIAAVIFYVSMIMAMAFTHQIRSSTVRKSAFFVLAIALFLAGTFKAYEMTDYIKSTQTSLFKDQTDEDGGQDEICYDKQGYYRCR